MTDKDDYPAKKGTILIPTGSQSEKHLFFVCSDPVFYPPKTKECILAVNISTIVAGVDHDPTCVLQKDDHPFIKHPSYVYYRKADIFGAVTVATKIRSGEIFTHEPCNDVVFRRIIAGFQVSDEVTGEIARFYTKYCK